MAWVMVSCLHRRARHALCGALLLLTASVPTATLAQGQMVCSNNGQDCSVVAPPRHAVTLPDYWRGSMAKPVGQRIGLATPEVIDYITQDNIKNDFPNRPRKPVPSAEFMRDLQQAFDELPVAIKKRLEGKLAGIMLAEDIGGTGYGEEVVDAEGKAVAIFVVLDSAILAKQTANAWATWKENTPFRSQAGHRLEAEIESGIEDNRKNAIQYILLHELGHVLAIGENIHPSTTLRPQEVTATDGMDYFRLTWRIAKEADRYATRFDDQFPLRQDVVYYLTPKLGAERMVEAYSMLEQTNLPTLYGATNPFDDWAEAFVTYVHTVMMNKPFAIRIYREGMLAKEYKACWSDPRCEAKRRIIERFLGVK